MLFSIRDILKLCAICSSLSSLRKIFSIFIIGFLIIGFQNCQSISDSQIGTLPFFSSPAHQASTSLQSEGNGETYDGKPIESFYRFVPAYTCNGTESPIQKIVKTEDARYLQILFDSNNNCNGHASQTLDESAIIKSRFQSEFLVYQERLYEKNNSFSLGDNIPDQLAEAMCRDDFQNPRFEIVSRFNRLSGDSETYFYNQSEDKLVLPTHRWIEASFITPTNENTSVKYSSTNFGLEIFLDPKANASTGIMKGKLQTTLGGLNGLEREVTCVVGSTLDTSFWRVRKLDINFISDINSLAQGIISYRTTIGTPPGSSINPTHTFTATQNKTDFSWTSIDKTQEFSLEYGDLKNKIVDVSHDGVLGYQFDEFPIFISTPLIFSQNPFKNILPENDLSILWSSIYAKPIQLTNIGVPISSTLRPDRRFLRSPEPQFLPSTSDVLYAVLLSDKLGAIAKNRVALRIANLGTGQVDTLFETERGGLNFAFDELNERVLIFTEAEYGSVGVKSLQIKSRALSNLGTFNNQGCRNTPTQRYRAHSKAKMLFESLCENGTQQLWIVDINTLRSKLLYSSEINGQSTFSIIQDAHQDDQNDPLVVLKDDSTNRLIVQKIPSDSALAESRIDLNLVKPTSLFYLPGANFKSILDNSSSNSVLRSPYVFFHNSQYLVGFNDASSLQAVNIRTFETAPVCKNIFGQILFASSYKDSTSIVFAFESRTKTFSGYFIRPDLTCLEFNRFPSLASEPYSISMTSFGFAFITGSDFYHQKDLFFVPIDGRPPLRIGTTDGGRNIWSFIQDAKESQIIFSGNAHPLTSFKMSP